MSEIGENLTTENPNKTVREKYLRRISFNLEGFPGDTGETRDFSSILAAIDNPIRGTITRLAETDFFSDILEAKVESLWQIGMYLSMYYDKDAYDCLWQCAISNDPGLEINLRAVDSLQSAFRNFPDNVVSNLKETALKGEGKASLIAARIASANIKNLNLNLTDKRKISVSADRASAYSLHLLQTRTQQFASKFNGTLSNWAGTEMYRLLTERVKGNPDWNSSEELISWAENKVEKRIQKIKSNKESAELYSGEATLGIELQGWVSDAIETVPANGKYIYKKFSHKDYRDIARIGRFLDSADRFFELPTLPTKSPLELGLVIQSLVKMGLVKTGEGVTSMHVTVGGLEASSDFREASAIQLLICGSVPHSIRAHG
ncbi:MAG: hypothetical protein UX13_C0039G0012 [Candidatus Woesebacteria bacterium GW2011_GWB1_45_5]|uniref:Uncharacterized protein n=1 Tax=Candidatus Woesebacteria bacterium GW2011_GWB1_45_5 TaxID=1618581 RepID=A0A0G1MMZ4_9BACT|nr:MAG: hypothetical protein UX13_C0039G0012 [Candidatus Woesebacteria bacterium GW2011_GWB1_45_5]